MSHQGEASLASTADPLLTAVAFPYRGVFYPYGFSVRIESNSAAILRAAEESWAGIAQRFDETPVVVRCMVTPGASQTCPGKPVFRAQRHLLTLVADAENFGCCDLEAGFGFAWVSPGAVAASEYLRCSFLEAMVYCMIEMRHVVALHSACVMLDGRGVLLTGDSGAGKSSLAFACAQRGWTYVSDDSSCLVRASTRRRVIGNPRMFRFREQARELFPELGGFKDLRQHNGEPTLEVSTSSLPGIETAPDAPVDYIVFLNRNDGHAGTPRLLPFPKEEARRQLFQDVWPADLPGRDERHAALARLLDAEIYEMRYRTLEDAVDLLEQLVRGGRS